MAVTDARKKELIDKFKMHENDTGSTEVQIALLTERINYLTEHFKVYKKDYHLKTGLMKLVGRRKGLLEYLKKNNYEKYRKILKELGLRK